MKDDYNNDYLEENKSKQIKLKSEMYNNHNIEKLNRREIKNDNNMIVYIVLGGIIVFLIIFILIIFVS